LIDKKKKILYFWYVKKGEIMRAIDKEFLEVKNRRTFRKRR
jgi:hypothetical protein